jgi:hypothetical protein
MGGGIPKVKKIPSTKYQIPNKSQHTLALRERLRRA